MSSLNTPSKSIAKSTLLNKATNEGIQTLSQIELVAILIGASLPDPRALELAQDIMTNAEQSLTQLTTWQLRDFLNNKGITERKAITIISALELGRRLNNEQKERKVVQIKTAEDVFALMNTHLQGLNREEFWIILLNHSSQVLRVKQVFVGGLHATSVDAKVIFRLALGEPSCSRLILVHNHPSGNCTPSVSDARITERLVSTGKALDLKVLDHVIYTDIDYFSFIEQGLLQ